MNLFTQLSLVANLGLATFAWWQHENAYSSAEAWLKTQVSKTEEQAQASCDDIRSCSSLWKIAFDIANNPKPPVSESESEVTETATQPESAQTHEMPTSSSEPIAHTDESHSSASAEAHPTEAEHADTADKEHAEKPHVKLPAWAADLERRAKNELVWGSEVELDPSEVDKGRVTLSSGSCSMVVNFQNGQYRVDASTLRK